MQMDRSIFNLGTSVEATSLYILLCALADEGEPLTLERVGRQWNGTKAELSDATAELIRRCVLTAAQQPITDGESLYLTPSHEWR